MKDYISNVLQFVGYSDKFTKSEMTTILEFKGDLDSFYAEIINLLYDMNLLTNFTQDCQEYFFNKKRNGINISFKLLKQLNEFDVYNIEVKKDPN